MTTATKINFQSNTKSNFPSNAQEASSDELVLSVRQSYDGPASDRPRPEWIRGTCPDCGGMVIANCYYVGSLGFLVIHECWASLLTPKTCDYRKIL